MATSYFTPAEVAALADTPPRVVEKAIEDGVIEVRRGSAHGGTRQRRLLSAPGLYYIAFLRNCPVHFSKAAKSDLWRRFKSTPSARLRTVTWELSPGVKVKPSEVLGQTLGRVGRYSKARDRWIRVDAEIMGGTPVIRGTRMSVYSVAGRVARGETLDDILAENPDLVREALETAVAYAKANPLVGRPGGRPWQG